MADHFEETIGLRVTALEAEAQSVREHFVELKEFITFSLTTQIGHLRTELKEDINRLERRFDGLERRFDGLEQRFDRLEQRSDRLEQRFDRLERRLGRLERRFDGLEQRFDGLEHRFDGLERKFDAHHEATRLILAEILDRLPARNG